MRSKVSATRSRNSAPSPSFRFSYHAAALSISPCATAVTMAAFTAALMSEFCLTLGQHLAPRASGFHVAVDRLQAFIENRPRLLIDLIVRKQWNCRTHTPYLHTRIPAEVHPCVGVLL
jgi:hypothetical protein